MGDDSTSLNMTAALAELHAAEAELANANAAIIAFKRRNMVVIDGRSAYMSASLTNRGGLDTELTGLVKASNLAWRKHQAAMKEYAEIKMRGVVL